MSISDIIEQFLLSSIGSEENLSISRNQLAEYFNCVPSQINYVLSTRFTIDKGYIVESRRGGGGYISIVKIPGGGNSHIKALLDSLDECGTITMQRASQILERLEGSNLITDKERQIILSALSDKALLVPETIKSNVRAHILRNILTELIKFPDKGGE